MRSQLLIVLLTVMMSTAIPVCDVHAYGDGGGSDSGTASDIQESSPADWTSFEQTGSFPLGIGCGWGIGVVGPPSVIGAGVNPSTSSDPGGEIDDSRSTSKDAETALGELRSGFTAGTMTSQDVKQDLQWGQQMGVYTSEQAQALLHDLNIERSQNQPPAQQESYETSPAQQQSPAAPPAPQNPGQTKIERDLESIHFLLSMILRDRDWDKSYFSKHDEDRWSSSFYDRDVKLTYWVLTTLYLKGQYQKGEYDKDKRNAEIRRRLQLFRDIKKK